MNNDRHKSIMKAHTRLNALKEKLQAGLNDLLEGVEAELEELQEQVDSERSDEQEYIDNLPENLQQSERAELAAEAVSYLETAQSKLDEVLEAIRDLSVEDDMQEALDALNDAAGV